MRLQRQLPTQHADGQLGLQARTSRLPGFAHACLPTSRGNPPCSTLQPSAAAPPPPPPPRVPAPPPHLHQRRPEGRLPHGAEPYLLRGAVQVAALALIIRLQCKKQKQAMRHLTAKAFPAPQSSTSFPAPPCPPASNPLHAHPAPLALSAAFDPRCTWRWGSTAPPRSHCSTGRPTACHSRLQAGHGRSSKLVGCLAGLLD